MESIFPSALFPRKERLEPLKPLTKNEARILGEKWMSGKDLITYQQPRFDPKRAEERFRDRLEHFLKTLSIKIDSGSKPALENIRKFADLGAGNAELTAKFARYLGTEVAYPIDIYLEHNFRNPDPEIDLEYRQTIKSIIPLDDESVDLVLAFVSLHHVPNLEMSLREIYRILTPGGFLFIREHDVDSQDAKKYLDKKHMEYASESSYEHGGGAKATTYTSKEELRDDLEDLGLEHVGDSLYPNGMRNRQRIYHSMFKKSF